MSSRSLAALAFTFLGVLALIYSVSLLGMILPMMPIMREYEGITWSAGTVVAFTLPLLLMVTIGALLILRRFRLAAWVCPEDRNAELAGPWRELPELVFAALGLFCVISTLPQLALLAGQLIRFGSSTGMDASPEVFRSQLVGYIGALAKLGVGAFLFVCSQSVARWWRGRGQSPCAQPAALEPQCPQCGRSFNPADYRDDDSAKLCSECYAVLSDAHFE